MSDTALGEVRNYADLHALCRARAEALELSRSTIDDVAGFTSGYAAKLLAPKPMKILGPQSFGEMLSTLGMKFIAVEDKETMQQFAAKRTKRTTHMVRAEGRHWVITKNFLRKIAAKGGAARARLSARKLTAIGRKAARARWDRVKAQKDATASSKERASSCQAKSLMPPNLGTP